MRTDNSSVCPLNIPLDDILHFRAHTPIHDWETLAGCRLFITGGTGFVGKWILSSLLDADKRLSLDCQISVLSRNPERFLSEWPGLRGRVEFVPGDVRTFDFPDHDLDVVIHAATDVAVSAPPAEVFSTCVAGTSRVLELVRTNSVRKLMLISSGAVYGPLPDGMTHVPETYMGGPDPLRASSAYAEGKRVSEWLACRTAETGVHVSIARVFALVGPHLPLDAHFAIGNFISNALRGEDIKIEGDGRSYRSYLYAADMVAWLWAILFRGRSSVAYNLGAEQVISIADLAQVVRDSINPRVDISIKRPTILGAAPSYYVPSTEKARNELHLSESVSLPEAISRTAAWHRGRTASLHSAEC